MFFSNWKIFRKKESMSRPRKIYLDLGEISLMGFPKEVADALESHIENFNKSAVPPTETLEDLKTQVKNVAEPVTPAQVVNKDALTLPHRAVGLAVHDNKYKVVTVALNLDTKEASVITVQNTDGKSDGINKFKQTASELRFV